MWFMVVLSGLLLHFYHFLGLITLINITHVHVGSKLINEDDSAHLDWIRILTSESRVHM